MSYVDDLRERSKNVKSIVCMGIDPVIEKIPIKGEPRQVIEEFYLDILKEMDISKTKFMKRKIDSGRLARFITIFMLVSLNFMVFQNCDKPSSNEPESRELASFESRSHHFPQFPLPH